MVLLSNTRQIKVVLIQPPSNCVEDDRLEPPLGLLYIAAVLKKDTRLDVELHDMSGHRTETEIDAAIEKIPEADAYGISVVCSTHKYAARITKQARRLRPDAFIVAGGPNPSAVPERTLSDLDLDSVVVGEGEDVFYDLILQKFSGSGVFKIVNGVGRLDIDTYPFPARDLVDMSTYTKKLNDSPSVPMLSSRGCPNHCVHCNSVVMGGGSKGARYRSIDNLLAEIKQIKPYTHIRFIDDNFTANPSIKELLKAISRVGVTFRVFGRLDDLDEELCGLLRDAGCVHISVGLESLNPDNLRVIGKAKLVGKYDNIQMIKNYGLTVRASFMVGLPYDTDDNISYYFQQAAQLPFDEFEIYPLIPFPGTPLALHPEKFGYEITDSDFTDYVLVGKNRSTTFALTHKNFSTNQIKEWREKAGDLLKQGGKCYMRESKLAR
ncbi:MAG: radical SAM protein [uncultured bacterium]|nr:MAG: radical SAM protein [uncultured bacterium]